MTETPNSIAQWADGTFGPATLAVQFNRARTEWEELERLMAEPSGVQDAETIAYEVADVIICLARILVQVGHPHAIDEKMALNRVRKWHVHGDGTAQHI